MTEALKQSSVESNKLWKLAGKPWHGPQKRLSYATKSIRDGQKANDVAIAYPNDQCKKTNLFIK